MKTNSPSNENPDLNQVMTTARESLRKGEAELALRNLYSTYEHAQEHGLLTEEEEQELHDLTAAALYAFLEQKDAIPIVEQEELLDAHA